MEVKFTNMGSNPRVVHDSRGKYHLIPVGESRRLDVNEQALETFVDAQLNGDNLHVSVANGDDHEPAPAVNGDGPETALGVLAKAANRELDYHSLLAAVNRVVPNHGLSQRPLISEMVQVLQREAARCNPAEKIILLGSENKVREAATISPTQTAPEQQTVDPAPVGSGLQEEPASVSHPGASPRRSGPRPPRRSSARRRGRK